MSSRQPGRSMARSMRLAAGLAGLHAVARLSRRVATWAPVASAVGVCLVGVVLVARTL